MAQKILVTTAIDYVNDVIHIGHAYQKIVADALARYYRQSPDNKVFFLTGTDEHGSKTEEAAEKKGVSAKDFTDQISRQDKDQLDILNISYDRFIRTTDPDHARVVEDFFRRVQENGRGDVYIGEYAGIYCVGCEEFKKEKDLENGHCPQHPSKDLKTLTERNYFFAWSRYEQFLRDWINTHPEFVKHEARRNEMLAFLDQGLEDIPISRPTVKFGIPVPGDPNHVLYVWFDALINYITGNPEFWEDESTEIIHILGKDNVRWHALLWPAMLKAAGYRLPSTVYGHDFFTLNGQKISKSLGNIIRPTELVDLFGVDAVRYYFLRYGPIRDDVDVTIDAIRDVYNGDLANGLGNLVARVAALASRSGTVYRFSDRMDDLQEQSNQVAEHIKNFRVDLALECVWQKIHELDRFVDHNRVWEQDDDEKDKSLQHLVGQIGGLGDLLLPFMPDTAERITKQFGGPEVKSEVALFPRIK